MDEVITPSRNRGLITLQGRSFARAIPILIIGLFIFLVIYRLNNPLYAVPASAPVTEFSSGRAMSHVAAVAGAPRPIGSSAHAGARDYLLNEMARLGLETHVQTATATRALRGDYSVAATVRNVVAKLPGFDSSKAVLLMGHYDSVPNSPGASDNASGVGIMIETARALKAAGPLKNDVIFLFTDGEEVGLLGARAFVDEHAWKSEAGVVINLDTLGIGGPAVMFETSPGNGQLINAFASAAPRPVASSLTQELYKLTPYDTDMSIFRKEGYPALNLAYLQGAIHHHSMTDSMESMDERSLQHQGEYATGLARHFGSLGSEPAKDGDSIYFDLLGSFLVRYPASWAVGLALLVSALFLAVLVVGIKNKRLTLPGVALGSAALLLGAAIIPAVVTLGWMSVRAMHGQYKLFPENYTYNSVYYTISFAALSIALMMAAYNWLRQRTDLENLAAGAQLLWVVILLAASFFMKGASYLFAWPLLFAILALAFTCSPAGRDSSAIRRAAVLALCSLPAVLLFVPIISLASMVMGLAYVGLIMIPVVLLIGLLVLQVGDSMTRARWALPMMFIILSVIFIGMGSLTSGFDRERPKPNNIIYISSADSGKAAWASFDLVLDEWTSQFFQEGIQHGRLLETLPPVIYSFVKNPPSGNEQAPPETVLLADTTSGEARTVRFQIKSQRHAPMISLKVFADGGISRALVNGKQVEIDQRNQWEVEFFAPPAEGFEIVFDTVASGPLRLRVTDVSYGLPDISGIEFKPRPDHMVPALAPFSDATLVTRTFKF